jgi:hypothetical protein
MIFIQMCKGYKFFTLFFMLMETQFVDFITYSQCENPVLNISVP